MQRNFSCFFILFFLLWRALGVDDGTELASIRQPDGLLILFSDFTRIVWRINAACLNAASYTFSIQRKSEINVLCMMIISNSAALLLTNSTEFSRGSRSARHSLFPYLRLLPPNRHPNVVSASLNKPNKFAPEWTSILRSSKRLAVKAVAKLNSLIRLRSVSDLFVSSTRLPSLVAGLTRSL